MNGEGVSRDRFLALIGAPLEAQQIDELAAAGSDVRAIVSRLIDDLLVEQYARRQQVLVGDDVVARELAALRATFPSAAAWEGFIRQRRGGIDELRTTLRQRVLREQLAGRPPPVTETEVRRYFDEHRARFDSPAAISVVDVAIPLDDPSEESDRIALARAHEIGARARTRTLVEVAHQRSGAAGRAPVLLTERSSDPELWRAASALTPGAVSEPIRARDGYHVIEVMRRVPVLSRTLAEARSQIEASLRERRRIEAERTLLLRLRSAAELENHLIERLGLAGSASTRARPPVDVLRPPPLQPVPRGKPAAGRQIGRP